MFVNFKNRLNTIENMIEKLNLSSIVFFLTGSRYFGGTTDESDWDFYTESTASTETILRDLGFQKLTEATMQESYLLSIGIINIYRFDIGSRHIDIQLVESINKKTKANELIKWFCQFMDFHKFGKEKKKFIWQVVMSNM